MSKCRSSECSLRVWCNIEGVVTKIRLLQHDVTVVESSPWVIKEKSNIVSDDVIEPTGVEVRVSIVWQRMIAYDQEVC